MSRWMIPARWAVSTAPAIWTAVLSAWDTPRGSRWRIVPREGGGQYSMTMKGLPSSETPAP